jgi:hypothetical protein
MKKATYIIFCCVCFYLVACVRPADTKETIKVKYSLIRIGMPESEVMKIIGKPNLVEPHLTGDHRMWKDRDGNVRIKIKFVPKVDRVMSKSWED